MLQKILSRLVGFQQETVEEINWKRIWQQLKWMNRFSKGYRGRIGVLTGLSIFFTLVGIGYAYVYKYVVDWIMPQLTSIIETVQGLAAEMRHTPLIDKLLFVYNLLPPWIVWVFAVYLIYKTVSYLYSLFMQFFTLRLSMDLALGIKRKVYATILESDWLSLTQYHAGDLVQRVSSEIGRAHV